jgi:hypothetical protein
MKNEELAFGEASGNLFFLPHGGVGGGLRGPVNGKWLNGK